MIGGMPLKKRNEMKKSQTANHATAPMPMGEDQNGPCCACRLVLLMTVGGIPGACSGDPRQVNI